MLLETYSISAAFPHWHHLKETEGLRRSAELVCMLLDREDVCQCAVFSP